jgi:hypothetical protein
MTDERNLYRARRRAFIAACDAAHVDAIARVQPGKAADGKPLFTDTAALGDRRAASATLVVSNDETGSQAQVALLQNPPAGRLVLVHALDPAHFGGPADATWAQAILKAVATEDLSRVTALTLTDLVGGLDAILRSVLPKAEITLSAAKRER